MKIRISCPICSSLFIKGKSGRTKTCSIICQSRNREFWSKASFEEKIKRVSKYFQKYVIRNKNDCWGWNGSLLSKRGRLSFDGKQTQAHRISWMIHNSCPIPSGMYVCHSCDNEICSNPEHLFLGSPSDNVVDSVKKNKRKSLKLNSEKVSNIRRMLKDGFSGTELAKINKVHVATISDIKLRKIWKHVD